MLSDFSFSFPTPSLANQKTNCADVSPAPARRSQGNWPLANYRLRNPERVSFGPRASVRPTQMLMRMKQPNCMVSALWPMECAFKEDSRGAWISQRIFSPSGIMLTSIYTLGLILQFLVGCDMDSAEWNLIPGCSVDPESLPSLLLVWSILSVWSSHRGLESSTRSIVCLRPCVTTIHSDQDRKRGHEQHVNRMVPAPETPGHRQVFIRQQCHNTNIKTVWARSCQVWLSTPLFQQTWHAL